VLMTSISPQTLKATVRLLGENTRNDTFSPEKDLKPKGLRKLFTSKQLHTEGESYEQRSQPNTGHLDFRLFQKVLNTESSMKNSLNHLKNQAGLSPLKRTHNDTNCISNKLFEDPIEVFAIRRIQGWLF
jgi:hypothetical protein